MDSRGASPGGRSLRRRSSRSFSRSRAITAMTSGSSMTPEPRLTKASPTSMGPWRSTCSRGTRTVVSSRDVAKGSSAEASTSWVAAMRGTMRSATGRLSRSRTPIGAAFTGAPMEGNCPVVTRPRTTSTGAARVPGGRDVARGAALGRSPALPGSIGGAEVSLAG